MNTIFIVMIWVLVLLIFFITAYQTYKKPIKETIKDYKEMRAKKKEEGEKVDKGN